MAVMNRDGPRSDVSHVLPDPEVVCKTADGRFRFHEAPPDDPVAQPGQSNGLLSRTSPVRIRPGSPGAHAVVFSRPYQRNGGVSMTWIEDLHQTLNRRATPEQVARIIRDSGISWPTAVQVDLRRVAAARPSWYVSSMSEDFERADGCAAQLAAVGRMFGVDVSDVRPDDLAGIRALIIELGQRLGGWMPGHDWKADRLNKAGRRSASYTVVARGLACPPSRRRSSRTRARCTTRLRARTWAPRRAGRSNSPNGAPAKLMW
jgi:hypothetical protein